MRSTGIFLLFDFDGNFFFWGHFLISELVSKLKVFSQKKLQLKSKKYKGTQLDIDVNLPKKKKKKLTEFIKNAYLTIVCECRHVTRVDS